MNKKTFAGDEKYSRVLEAMEALNYNPNYQAINLKSKKTNLVAIVIPELNALYSQIITGIQRTLEKRSYSTLVKTTNYNKYAEETIIDEMLGMNISGILLTTCNSTNAPIFGRIAKKKIPLIFIENYIPGNDYTSVVFDNQDLI